MNHYGTGAECAKVQYAVRKRAWEVINRMIDIVSFCITY